MLVILMYFTLIPRQSSVGDIHLMHICDDVDYFKDVEKIYIENLENQ